MNRERFIRQRRDEWQQFESLVGRLQVTRTRKWRSGDIATLSRMYRSICYDLSLVQSREWGARLEQYLNDLVAQGHNCLYRSPPQTLHSLIAFFSRDFPQLLRRRGGSFLIAAALFGLPFLIAAAIGWARPELAEFVVTQQAIDATRENFETATYTRFDDRYARDRLLMSGFYVFNNAGIALQAYALGAFCGVGTAIILLFNGIELGSVFGYVAGQGGALAENFFSFVITHGAFELTAIVISGTAGIVLGQGLLFPGDETRAASLRRHGLESLQLALGAAAMLGVAAAIEAFFSPLPIPAMFKYAAGTLAWLVVGLYLWQGGGREDRSG